MSQTTTPAVKYRWNFSIGWAVEYVRKDAEITISLDDDSKFQKVIVKNCKTREDAERVAVLFCEGVAGAIRAAISDRVSHLSHAKE